METETVDLVEEKTLPSRKKAPLSHQVLTVVVVILPLVALLGAIIMLYVHGLDKETLVALGLFVLFYFITGMGVTAGYHRLFTHRSYDTTTWIKVCLTIAGSMSLQGFMLAWCKDHNVHHEWSDVPQKDRHTPHGHDSFWKGLWYSHVGWLFLDSTEEDKDQHLAHLEKNRAVMWADSHFFLWTVLGFILPMLIGGLLTLSWKGAWLGLLWGGLVRLCVVHHLTWSINSICHLFGSKPFKSDDESRNCTWLIFTMLGEVWHNTHHAFKWSARHGLEWWQIDCTWYFIWTLGKLSLAWSIRVPTPDQIRAKLRTA